MSETEKSNEKLSRKEWYKVLSAYIYDRVLDVEDYERMDDKQQSVIKEITKLNREYERTSDARSRRE